MLAERATLIVQLMSNRNPGRHRSSGMSEATGRLISSLEELRADFGPRVATRKLNLLKRLSKERILDQKQLAAYHDLLCFLLAYPENATLRNLCDRELRDFGRRVDSYKAGSRDKQGRRLVNSGITNTTIEFPFGYDALLLLHKWYPRTVEIDWDDLSDEEKSGIFEMLPLLVGWVENDTLDNDAYFDEPTWLEAARGKQTPSDLGTLLRLLARSRQPLDVQRLLYEKLNLNVTWQLTDQSASRTLSRVPTGRVYYQRSNLLGRSKDLRRQLLRPATPMQRLSPTQGRKAVRLINEMLAVRYRELFPITFASPAEVYVAKPGRGVQLFLFGSAAEIRLPLEANFGAMLVRNGVPIGYGIGACLFDRVEIAINIFPTFRSGESAFIMEHFFRLFYHHFGSRLFLVRSRQMGDGDDEPLKSGAFWFYYKLGFRAVKARIRKLAEEEFQVIKARQGYRSPLSKLRQLSKSDVFLHIKPELMGGYEELSLVNLGKVVTRYFAENYDGDRERGTREAVRKLARILGVKGMKRWSEDERTAFTRLAPLIICIPDLPGWPVREKSALIQLLRAKGAPQERKFVLQSNRHALFRTAIERLAQDWAQGE